MNACRVVLVRPEIAANVGAAARVMCNLGASDLVLVAPAADHLGEQAAQLATPHARPLLAQARVVADLATAVADCVLVAGTSARTGGLYRRQTVAPPEAVAPRLVEALASGPAALVFGPEPHGLSNEEVVQCQHLIHVPTEPNCPALNLAQAVAICLYEVRRAWRESGLAQAAEAATHAEQARMFARLEEALREVRYLRGSRAGALMHALRHLIGRARPSPMEVRLLLGLAQQLRWVAERADLDARGSESTSHSCPETGRSSEGNA